LEKLIFTFYDNWKERKEYLKSQSSIGFFHYWTLVLLLIIHFWISPLLFVKWLPSDNLLLLLIIPYFLLIIPIANLLLPFVPYVPFKSKILLILNLAVIFIPVLFIGIINGDFLIKSILLILLALFWFKEEIINKIRNLFR
jgi:hypothetical protein